MDELGGLRAHVHQLVRDRATSPELLLERAIAENPDSEGLLLLIQSEIAQNRKIASRQTIERVVTKQVPAENLPGASSIEAVPATEIRRKLLAMTTDGGPSDVAARYLRLIDSIRDDYGVPESEPRHPDLKSGKAWPILRPGPDASEGQ